MASRTRAQLVTDIDTINDGGGNTPGEVRALVQNVVDSAPNVTIGAGAPVSTPEKIGDFYINSTTGAGYRAKGTASAADWIENLDSGTGDDLVDTAIVGSDLAIAFDASAAFAPISRTYANLLADLNVQLQPAEGGFANGDKTKLDHISVTQAVNLDQMETDIAALASGMTYQGNWDASTGSFPGGGTARTGAFYYVSVGGTVDGVVFDVGDNIVATTDNASTTTYAANWSKHDQTDAVQSVAGLVGTITASGLRAAMDVEPGVDFVGFTASLGSFGGIAITADQLPYGTGTGVYGTATLTAFARTLLDDADAPTGRATLGAAALGANTFTGAQNFNGQQVEGMLNKFVDAVTGALTAAAHSGNILKTSGNITIPTTAGFNCVVIAGGAHTVTFNALTSAAMAAGDVMTIVVESPTIIHAVLTPAADKVSFA